MKAVTLCSGSKGNSTYIEVNNIKMLFDCGRNYKYLNLALDEIGVSITEIQYVFITHSHLDHTSALKTIINRTNAKICITKKIYESLKEEYISPNIEFYDKEYPINDVLVKSIKASHDSPGTKNFVIEYQDKKIALVTDTGYIKKTRFKELYNSDIFLIESNHDIDLLQNGPYPDYLKKRILSDEGHLSNKQTGFYLSKLIGPSTKYVHLIHLSAENNSPEVAIETVNKYFEDYEIKGIELTYATPDSISEVMTID